MHLARKLVAVRADYCAFGRHSFEKIAQIIKLSAVIRDFQQGTLADIHYLVQSFLHSVACEKQGVVMVDSLCDEGEIVLGAVAVAVEVLFRRIDRIIHVVKGKGDILFQLHGSNAPAVESLREFVVFADISRVIGCENVLDIECFQHLGSSANVVFIEMGDYQVVDNGSSALLEDRGYLLAVALFAAVDDHGGAFGLEHNSVSLSHVEECDFQLLGIRHVVGLLFVAGKQR